MRKYALFQGLLLLFILIQIFLFTSCSDSSGPDNTAKIEGSVIDALTGEPVSGVQISTNPVTSNVFTDSKGKFVITNMQNGQYNLKTLKLNYHSSQVEVIISDSEIKTHIVEILLYHDSINIPMPNKPILLLPENHGYTLNEKPLVSWQISGEYDKNITYEVFIKKDDNQFIKLTELKDATSYQLESLEKGKKYYWRVIARDRIGRFVSSDVNIFEVKPTLSSDGSLLLQIPFDNILCDYSQNNHNIKSFQVKFESDRNGNMNSAIRFLGSDSSYIMIPSPNNLNLGKNFTIAFWIKPDVNFGKPAYNNSLYYFGRWGTPGVNNQSWIFLLDNRKHVFHTYNHVSNFKFYYFNNEIINEQWSHICVTASDQKLKMFYNGNLVNTQDIEDYPQDSNFPLYIGRHQNANTSYYSGCLDEIMIYSRSLSETEVLKLAK